MGRIAFLFSAVFFCIFVGCSMYQKDLAFDNACTGHIKRAADATNMEMATTELQIAVSFLEKEELTTGYTSVFIRTPDEDIGFWYKNLKSALADLRAIPGDSPDLVKTNHLMKLRETLLDHGQYGDSVTAPAGIELYPSIVFWWTLIGLSALTLVVAFVVATTTHR